MEVVNNGSSSGLLSNYNIIVDVPTLNMVQLQATTSEDRAFRAGSQLSLAVPYSNLMFFDDSNVKPDNIKAGVNLLGIMGNYSGSVNLTNLSVTTNGVYNAPEGYDGFNVVTVAVSGSGHQTDHIFNSYNDMVNYSSFAEEGDVAFVYRTNFENLHNFEVGSNNVTYFKFAESFTLPNHFPNRYVIL